MCCDVEFDLDDEMIINLSCIVRTFLHEKEVNHDTVSREFDDKEFETFDCLLEATGNVVTNVFITDSKGLRQYLHDLFFRWDIDPCSRGLLNDDIECKKELRTTAGKVIINHVIVNALKAMIVDPGVTDK